MHDVVVIGGGVSGLSCAFFLAEAGIDVVVLESSSTIGGFIAENLQGFLKHDINKIPIEIPRRYPSRKIVLWSPSKEKIEIEFDEPICYLVKRGPNDSFDSFLAKKARRAGAEIITSSRVIKCKWGSKGLFQVETQNGEVYTAKYFVAADGVTSTMRRLSGVGKFEPKGLGFGMKMRNVKIGALEMHGILNLEIAPHGYCYFIGYPDGKYATVVVAVRTRYMKKNIQQYFYDFLHFMEEITEDARQINKFSRAVTCNDGKQAVRYQNLLFIGEAAGVQDPTFGFGMTPSIRSSKFAADAIIQSIKSKDASTLQLYEYRLRREIFSKEIRRKWNFRKAILEHMNNDDIEIILQAIRDNQELFKQIIDRGNYLGLLKIIAKAVRKKLSLIRFMLYTPFIFLPTQI